MWKTICVAAGFVALTSAAGAQPDTRLTDVTGTWVMNLESHQLGLELEQKGSKVEGVLHAMGAHILLVGTYADRKLELKGERAEDQLPHAGKDAGPIVATMLDDGTFEGELSTTRGRSKWTGERFKKP
jgi:hypothetical protein